MGRKPHHHTEAERDGDTGGDGLLITVWLTLALTLLLLFVAGAVRGLLDVLRRRRSHD